MHFASAAAWWQPESEHRHAHSPKNVQQLRDWSSSTLAYIVQEFGWLASKYPKAQFANCVLALCVIDEIVINSMTSGKIMEIRHRYLDLIFLIDSRHL